MVAFHSFKGGVGRTTHAIGFSLGAAARSHRPVLLLDGDFEAPGISWHVQDSGRVSISYADFLALVHSDVSSDASDALALTARKLQGQRFGSLIVLPAFRKASQWSTLEVPPCLLQDRNPEDPYQLTVLLARLGAQVHASAVVVDLRAGMSELSAGLLLDPRVARVVVTTLSSQSLRGTQELLARLGRQAPPRTDAGPASPPSALIINSVPEDFSDLTEVETDLLRSGSDYFALSDDSTSGDVVIEPLLVRFPYDRNLHTLPLAWNEAERRITKADVLERLRPIVDEIVPTGDEQLSSTGSSKTLKERRAAVAEFATRLEYAEGSETEDFLRIRALSNLARDYHNALPLVVMTGAKGAGKTYTFLQILRRQFWGRFVEAAATPGQQQIAWDGPAMSGSPSLDVHQSLIVPVIASTNLQPTPLDWIKDAEEACQSHLGLGSPFPLPRIREYARKRIEDAGQRATSWREWWLDVIAWRCGFRPGQPGAGDALLETKPFSGRSVLVLLDGLEDLFQDIHSSLSQQEALRALVQDVPEWIRQGASGIVGLLVFVRSDLVRSAVRQNSGQLIAKYEPYHLRWDDEEALRLAAWVGVQSRAMDTPGENLHELGLDQLVSFLRGLWGERMGSPKSKEAASDRWILAALSDFRSQVQARDMVRLIGIAAQKSAPRDEEHYADRLLAPSALRDALEPCGRKKIEELQQETPSLQGAFAKVRGTPEEDRQVPFDEGAFGLARGELELLVEQGLVLRDGAKYYMTEVVRHGLGVSLARRGRPRVLALRRRGFRRT